MRRKLIAGNWKMNMDLAGGVALAKGIAEKAGEVPTVDLLVCPPSVYIGPVAEAVKGSALSVGGQNMYFADSGAFTGEVSAAMLLDVGAKYVILGHSERRHIFKETDADVNKKTHARWPRAWDRSSAWASYSKNEKPAKRPRLSRANLRVAGRNQRGPDQGDRHRLRAGLGHWYRQSGDSRAGGGGPC